MAPFLSPSPVGLWRIYSMIDCAMKVQMVHCSFS